MSYARKDPVEIIDAPDDLELARRALARDGAAFRTIMKTHNQRLYRLARGVVRNNSEAEDIVQEAYVNAFAHLGSFRGEFNAGNVAFPHRDQRSAGAHTQEAARSRLRAIVRSGRRWPRSSSFPATRAPTIRSGT